VAGSGVDMARKIDKLSDKRIKAATKRGIYGDGDGLYLQVARNGHRSWIYRFQIHGRRRTMGLGPYPRIALKKARELRLNRSTTVLTRSWRGASLASSRPSP